MTVEGMTTEEDVRDHQETKEISIDGVDHRGIETEDIETEIVNGAQHTIKTEKEVEVEAATDIDQTEVEYTLSYSSKIQP